MFSSSVTLVTHSKDQLESYLEELREYARLCKVFGSSYIRVFGGHMNELTRREALEVVSNNLKKMLEIAVENQVCILLETHDDWTKCEHVLDILQSTESEYLQVLWDVHHPYRLVDEAPDKTWEALGDRIKYTHWKDSYLTEKTDRGYQLCVVGDGDVPLESMYKLLKEKGYDGYYTLEWEKVWWPDIEEPEIAFAAYTTYMRALEANGGERK